MTEPPAHDPRRTWPGLTAAEAAKRLASDGPNALPQDERRGPLAIVFEVVKEPMFLLLLASAGLYLAFGDVREALTLLGFVVVVLAITIVQEGRTERALDALKDLSSPRAMVLRDGHAVTVPGRDVVRGDVLKVAEGDRVPADAILREGTALAVDESLLTGESVAVTKTPAPDADALSAPGGAGGSLYAGTLIVSGRGVAEVVATGARSELGRIGASLKELAPERTPLQRDVDRVVRRVAIAGLATAAALVVALGLSGGQWMRAALSGITLAMALLPEEFPVVLTVFLALGAWRIARREVLTRRVTAVETLGGVDVLCTDKTGTLTQNRMAVRRLVTLDVDLTVTDDADALPEPVHSLVEYAILASPRDPFDPMELAFARLGERALHHTEHLHPQRQPLHEYPLSPKLLAVTHVWRERPDGSVVVATKGAPEAVFDLCHLDDDAVARWRERVSSLARDGLRVLAVARGVRSPERSPDDAHDLDFAMAGLVGLEDPLRPAVPGAVAACREAAVRVMMITGDHPDTALAIARKAGLDAASALTGPELDAMDDDALAAALDRCSVVARAVPAQKLRIVKALRARGLRVAMTGDGVNDAPALKAADIGVAMGERGTDVAREAAGLVLVHDDFAAIVDAVALGRRIYDNLRNAFGYIVAVHIPIAGFSLASALLGWGALLAPAHVVFLELVIDPACSVVFEMEPAADDVMRRPPRRPDAPLFTAARLGGAVAQGLLALAATLFSVHRARAGDAAVEAQRAVAFVTLVLANLAILVASRAGERPFWTALGRRNPAAAALISVAALLAVGLALTPAGRLLAMGPLAPAALGEAAALAVLPVLALDALKALRRPSEQ
ncbi:MAG: cation-translocating P-type ATPase [Polyangiales bacterium]